MPSALPTPVVEETGPIWTSLSTAQQEALAPLQLHWSILTEGQKRSWIAIASGFQKLSPANQGKMQARMTAWAALTPEQRSRARLNYAATKKIAPPAKQEQWEAYQALSADAKKDLAAQAAPPPQGAAIVVRPTQTNKFARVPAASGSAAALPNPPKILPPVVDMVPVPVHRELATPASASGQPAVVETTPVATPSAAASPLPPLGDEAQPLPAASAETSPIEPVTPTPAVAPTEAAKPTDATQPREPANDEEPDSPYVQ